MMRFHPFRKRREAQVRAVAETAVAEALDQLAAALAQPVVTTAIR
jgi:hypothetical protein